MQRNSQAKTCFGLISALQTSKQNSDFKDNTYTWGKNQQNWPDLISIKVSLEGVKEKEEKGLNWQEAELDINSARISCGLRCINLGKYNALITPGDETNRNSS